MTREQIQYELDQMRQQEAGLSLEVARFSEQLTMTRGAIQMLEHLLVQEDGGVGELTPPAAQHNAALVDSMNGRPIEEADHASATD